MSKKQLMPVANKRFLGQFEAQERQHIAELAAAGQLVGLDRMAELLGVTPQAIADAETSCRIFSLDAGDGNRLYPPFYASPHLKRELIEEVTMQLGHLAGSSKWQFFTSPRLSLGARTPIEALKAGDARLVFAAAEAFREG